MNEPNTLWKNIAKRYISKLQESSTDFLFFMYTLEQAFYFYLNETNGEDTTYQRINFLEECERYEVVKTLFEKFDTQKKGIPKFYRRYRSKAKVCGAAMVEDTGNYILVTQGFGANRQWLVPSGKFFSDNEKPYDCAAREVDEEVSYPICETIEQPLVDKKSTIFIQRNVPVHFPFRPQESFL